MMDHRMVSKKGGGIYEGGRGWQGIYLCEGGIYVWYLWWQSI